MNVFEIISSALLILCSVMIVVLVLAQDSKGNGLSGVITGSDAGQNEGRTRSKDVLFARYTKIAAIAFFVLAIGVGIISAYMK